MYRPISEKNHGPPNGGRCVIHVTSFVGTWHYYHSIDSATLNPSRFSNINTYLSNTCLIMINFSASAIRVFHHIIIIIKYITRRQRLRPRPVGTHYFLLSRPVRNQLDRLSRFIHRLSPPPSSLIQENIVTRTPPSRPRMPICFSFVRALPADFVF